MYREGDKVAIVPIEHLGDPHELLVRAELGVHWILKGGSLQELTDLERHVVLTRIEDVLKFLGRNYSIRP